METECSEQLTGFKARLDHLRKLILHIPCACLSRHMESIKSQTQPSGSPDQEGGTSSLSERPTELHAASNILESSPDCDSSADTCMPDSSLSDVGDDPDVPQLTRTDSVIITKAYLEQISKVSDGSEASISCIESSGDEYVPSKDLVHESTSEEPDGVMSKVPLVKQKMSQKVYKRKRRSRTSDEDKRRAETETSDETNQANMSVMKLLKKADGGRDYSKKQSCLYCPVQCVKMSRHLVRKHSSEPAVAKAMSFPLKSKERKLNFDLIRNKGNHAHNNEVLKTGRGTLIPSQQTAKQVKASDYMHCINCEAFLKRKALWRHMSRCRLARKCSTLRPGKNRIQSICAFAQPVPEGVSRKVWELVNAMHQDEVTNIIKQEKSILRFGEHLYAKHGHDKTKHEYIRQKMREIGRLIEQSQKAGRLKRIEDFYVPSNFNFVVEAVRDVAGFDEEKNLYKTPSLALKLGHTLKKIADILECEAQMAESDNEEFLKNVKTTRSLYEKKWDVCVSSRALQTLKEGKWNTPQLLPFTEDVKKMHMHLDKCREEYKGMLENLPNKKSWSKLANVTLCEVILFNRRREGEVSKMPLSAFTLRDTSGVHSDVALGLSELEQKLCQHFQRIEIRGKRNRKVPILLTPDMMSSMETLVAHRRTCGVPDDNPFFFARPEAETHLRGSDAIRQLARQCGAKHPETLSSTKLRKQVSTLSTVLNLRDNEMDTLANFLGHDIRVHRQYYRLPEGTLELAKVSKVLLALEQGRLSDFQGMSLDQIQIDPNEDVPEAMDSDLSEMEGERDSSFCSQSSGSSASNKGQQPVESDIDDPKPGTSTPKRRKQSKSDGDDTKTVKQQTSDDPGSVKRVTKGSSGSNKRQQPVESDIDDPKPGTSTPKRRKQSKSDGDDTKTGSSRSKKRRQPDEPDSDDPKTGSSRAKIRQQSVETDINDPKTDTSKKRGWSTLEVRAVEKTLSTFIDCGKVPGKVDCDACIEASPEALKNRTWKAVKFYVKNRITAIRRESAKRTY
ncbi:uncharacterized protein [Trachinotus anak]